MITYFEPTPDELPAVLPSPFDPGPPHPLAQRAADALLAELAARPGIAALHAPGGGKMFGVLVVADGARVGFLRGFSGMFEGAWRVAGFVPPLYDEAAREAIWPDGQRQLRGLERELRALIADPAYADARQAYVELAGRHAGELAALRERHRGQRAERHRMRAAGGDAAALDRASRGDAAERRRLDAAHDEERAAVAARLDAFDRAREALERQRADESRQLMVQVHDSYVIANARGEHRPLRALFAPGEPPAGAGDCAGPKLLGAAYRLGLVPLALAEVWWGAPPATGGRAHGQLYPSCRGKCGPILPFMLSGLAHAAPPVFGADAAPGDPRVVFEDAWLVVLDKPCGLLSVPGRSGQLADSVLTRLRARLPGASVVHRLDLDTSGLLVCAKDPDTHARLQRAFAERQVTKRYVALLEGEPRGDGGTIALALRVDLDDRPRQIVDPVHGKPALTDWRVIARGARTRVALVPHTGRTHQLRVHAAHPDGIGVPIVGDRLYGRAADRLALHAEAIALCHPRTGVALELVSPAPF